MTQPAASDGLIQSIGGGWGEVLADRLKKTDREELEKFLAGAWTPRNPAVYPDFGQVFRAFEMTPLEEVQAVILGQDPYPMKGQACGLAFSVPREVKRPRSLARIIKKVEEDLGVAIAEDATLESWAHHGVLLLNTALTVRDRAPASHRTEWRSFTRAVRDVLAERERTIVFLLWGAAAQKWCPVVQEQHHVVLEAAHPAARFSPKDPRSFAASHPFRDTKDRICWRLD